MKKIACWIVGFSLMVGHLQAKPPEVVPPGATTPNAATYQLTVELRDGSSIVGKSGGESLGVHSALLGEMKLPWSGIRSIDYSGPGDEAHLIATNDDAFSVQISVKTLGLTTAFGKIELPVSLIRSIKVKPLSNPEETEAPDASAVCLTIEMRDHSRLVGKGLDELLEFRSKAMGPLKLPWTGIRSIEFGPAEGDSAQLTAANGDVYEVQPVASALQVEASFGKTELPMKSIRRITVSKEGNGSRHLIGWWKLDEGTGTVAKDSTQNRHDGNLVNGPAWIRDSGLTGPALDFNGSNQYVSLGNILQGEYKEFSMACWINHPKTSVLQEIVERSTWDLPEGIGLMTDYNSGSIDFGHYQNCVLSKSDVQDGQWHHVVGTISPSGTDYLYSIYVDGKLDNTLLLPIGFTATTNGWSVGARSDGTWPSQGMIADLRFYDQALSPSEVSAIYREHSPDGHPVPPTRGARFNRSFDKGKIDPIED